MSMFSASPCVVQEMHIKPKLKCNNHNDTSVKYKTKYSDFFKRLFDHFLELIYKFFVHTRYSCFFLLSGYKKSIFFCLNYFRFPA